MNNSAILLNVVTGEWRQLASISFSSDLELHMPMCGLATRSDGSRVVVLAGGSYGASKCSSYTHIYELEQDFWIPGPHLPEERGWGRAVQYEDTFIIVGGRLTFSESSIMLDTLLRFDPDVPAWEVMEQRLENPDYVSVALIAPDDFPVNCS